MTTGKTIALTRWTFVGKVMSLLFNTLSRLVITSLPRGKRLLISLYDLLKAETYFLLVVEEEVTEIQSIRITQPIIGGLGMEKANEKGLR